MSGMVKSNVGHLNGAEKFPGRFCSDGVLTVEGAVGRRGRRPSTMGTSSLQDGVAPLALDLCPAGTPGTTPGTGMLPGNLEQPISSADTPVEILSTIISQLSTVAMAAFWTTLF